jgi:hypothetical protein
MNTRIPAFTLFELILGMLLSAIVIGVVYSAWFLFSRVYQGYIDTGSSQSEIIAFRKVLAADMDKASLLKVADNELVLLDSAGAEQLRYLVIDGGVLRKHTAVLDTFPLEQVVLQPAFEYGEVRDSLADQLTFSFFFKGEPLSISLSKSYSSQDLFKTR